MKTKDLIAALQELDPESIVICQSDAEGNSYSPLAGADKGVYVEDSTWSGAVYNTVKEMKSEHGNIDYERCVVLFPVN